MWAWHVALVLLVGGSLVAAGVRVGQRANRSSSAAALLVFVFGGLLVACGVLNAVLTTVLVWWRAPQSLEALLQLHLSSLVLALLGLVVGTVLLKRR